jgi:hypothetical protein
LFIILNIKIRGHRDEKISVKVTASPTPECTASYASDEFNDCYWYDKEDSWLCIRENKVCVGIKECKYYETAFQHLVKETIKKDNEKKSKSKITGFFSTRN